MQNYLIFIHKHAKPLFWLSFLGVNFALFTPSVGAKGEIYNLDIIIHYSMFLTLAFFALFSFCHIFLDRERYDKNAGKIPVIVTLTVLALFIPLSELIQENFIPGRGYELTDILSGLAGLLSGFLLYYRLRILSIST